MTPTYYLHGLRIRSELPIPAPTASTDSPDLEVQWGDRRPIPNQAPAGRLLALLEGPHGAWSAAMGDAGHTVRAHGLCDFEMDLPLRRVAVHLAPDALPELGPLLLGSALSTLLTLRGHCVLHASAVQIDEGVVAFVGPSGRGKTTMAALCCAVGAGLVSDDALRVESSGDSGWCFSGSRELRLRSSAVQLADTVDGDRAYTADGRMAVGPRAGGSGRLPLAAIVAPVCLHGGGSLRIERLRGPRAVIELISHPHSAGWVDAQAARRDFSVLSALAANVPVHRAEVPWGPPFFTAWAQSLLAVVRSGQATSMV